jgi:hypothetical protein
MAVSPLPFEELSVSVEEEESSLALADHLTYAEAMYGQPSWVLEGAIQNAGFTQENTYTRAQVQEALDDMLGQKDRRFQEE